MKKTMTSPYPPCLTVQAISGAMLFVVSDSRVFRGWCVAMAAFWGWRAFAMLRRRLPTRLDVFLIRWGFAPLLVVTIPLSELIWSVQDAQLFGH